VDYDGQIIKSSTESYVILRNTFRSLCYIDAHILAIASKYYAIHCLPIAPQYNVFSQFGVRKHSHDEISESNSFRCANQVSAKIN
jgi:hypothetical protein